ncbi:MAG: hypothetical protein R3E32_26540 [Chitinophagales bacterium]
MRHFIITITMIFASITLFAQNGNDLVASNNADEQKKEQTTVEVAAQKEVKPAVEKEELSIFDNNILSPEAIANVDKNKKDK